MSRSALEYRPSKIQILVPQIFFSSPVATAQAWRCAFSQLCGFVSIFLPPVCFFFFRSSIPLALPCAFKRFGRPFSNRWQEGVFFKIAWIFLGIWTLPSSDPPPAFPSLEFPTLLPAHRSSTLPPPSHDHAGIVHDFPP